jgi:eukaryotic-like serine/threonine-protein kinase
MGKKMSRAHQCSVVPGDGAHKPRPSAGASSDEAALPAAGESSWEDLGSTRVVSGGVSVPGSNVPIVRGDMSPFPEVPDFQLLTKLGEGAMGAVYKARQISFDRDVALKVLFPHVASNPKLVDRLRREGRVMGRLDHPNIVQAYVVDEYQGSHYVAMEYVDGQSMQKWLGRVGRLTPADAVNVALACARALAYAHNNDVIHRDIKPDNILVTKSGIVKVADLGMVKTTDEDMSLTQTGHAVGTPWYMPLEQARNAKEIDGRSDIYALGCTLYCLLTGHPPFTGRTIVEVIQAKEQGTFPPARQFNAEIPERLDLLLAKMVAKLPKNRQQTCEEVVQNLEALQLAGASLQFVSGKGAAGPKVATPTPTGSSSDRTVITNESDPNLWYVVFKSADGKEVPRKYTTAQLEKMLGEGLVSGAAKASRTLQGTFRALATYKEFQSSAMVKLTKKSADKNTSRYRNIYKQIEEKEQRRDKKTLAREERKQALNVVENWGKIVLAVGGALLALAVFGGFAWYIAGMFAP